MVLEWCISVADVLMLLLLSKFAEKSEKKEIVEEIPDIDYVTGRKLPYVMIGDEYYIDPETGTKVACMAENYDED